MQWCLDLKAPWGSSNFAFWRVDPKLKKKFHFFEKFKKKTTKKEAS